MAIDLVEKFKRFLQEDRKSTKAIECYVGDIAGFAYYISNMGRKVSGRIYIIRFRRLPYGN